jgi:rod shape determining protein RodA
LGFFVVVVTAALDYHLFNPIGKIIYVLVAVLLVAVELGGQAAFGAQRAIDTGLFFIQPSELAKIAMILVLADFFTRNAFATQNLRWIFRSLVPTLLLVVPVFLQPDLSTSIVLMVIWFALLWASGLETRHIVLFGVIGIALIVIGFPFLADYQQERVFTFLFPDPNETFGNNYNVTQARISVGAGGWFGQGYGQGSQVQLRFLKVRHTDFIFSALANELGFVGALVVLALLAFVMYRCLRAGRLSKDTFGALICYGVTAFLFFHTAANIGMNLNLIPVTGLPLPFLSMGGSSLLSMLLGVGLVESVVLRHKALEF